MGRKKLKRKKWKIKNGFNGGFTGGMNLHLENHTKRGIIIIVLCVAGVLSLLALFGLAGTFGEYVVKMLGYLFGGLKWIFPFIVFVFAYFLFREEKYQVRFINYMGAVLFVLGLTALWHLRYEPSEAYLAAKSGLGGGFFGLPLSMFMVEWLGLWGTIVLDLGIFFIGMLLFFEMSIHGLMWPIKFMRPIFGKVRETAGSIKEKRYSRASYDDGYEEEEAPIEEEPEEEEEEEESPEFVSTTLDNNTEKDNDDYEEVPALPKKFGKQIDLPLALLTGRSGKPTSGDIRSNQEVIRKTLANFNINVEMGEVNIGPTVTQYTFRPADGVKLSKIVNLNSDLSLALAAHPIRIEAPIPGKSLVGVEIPNQLAARVTMSDLLSSKNFKKRDSDLSIAMGKDVSGKSYFAKLDKMPHLLIAGATGSGKSVCINSIIISLMYQNSPDDLKFILVDPKRVELPIYNNIPYLLTPVITDVKKTINALKWTILEMERRFELLSKKGKRNIEAYNKSHKDKLPYIVFVIDELADLMSAAASDIEAGIVRLAQMSRAVGIHLVLATQRPSVEVITGLIKANIPARIAFSVVSLIDSRTILDTSGAEKLVGRGDMLYIGPETSKPKRLQGVFLSDKEINAVVNYIKNQGTADYADGIVERQDGPFSAGGGLGDVGDSGEPLLEDAKNVIREAGKASASLLQRRLKIGYARAARILDILEEMEIVGPAEGSKPREVYIDKLGGVDDVVEFSAKEHEVEDELEQETTSTVFKSNTENIETNDEDDEDEEDDGYVEEQESDDDIEDELNEEIEKRAKTSFDEDEWT